MRWESSKRPLFVKYVWIEGRRHFVLFDGDPLKRYLKLNSSASSRASSSVIKRNSNSAPSASQASGNATDNGKNLCLQSIKMPLVKATRDEKIKRNRLVQSSRSRVWFQETTVEVTPRENLRYTNLNAEILLNNTGKFTKTEEKLCHSNGIVGDNLLGAWNSSRQNSLSDKVLVWLDLATKISPNLLKSDIVSKLHRNAAKQSRLQLNRSRSYDCYENIKFEKEKRRESFFEMIDAGESDPLPKCKIATSQNETDRRSKTKTEILKRQLHVFIPKIVKKNEDTNSTLSSKSSSLVNQK